ncbi:phosphatase PAP2 family protein [Corynebacterium canis]|uniref:Phosphatase PAP2 family protein n=2 Tax=Corynebacterium canis TaxID=679663 RepID=A0A5C5UIV1_9CORY|nr:phosphatase PAP2 family protein [Corynebacterium canis]
MSFFGEHAAGWLALGLVGAVVDKRRRGAWLRLAVAAFVSHAASVVLKRVVRRPRPDDERITIGVSTPSKLSFPSSHATSTTAALVSLSTLAGRRTPLLGVPLMMLSRMILGVHYPTDVAVGALLGALTAKLVQERQK